MAIGRVLVACEFSGTVRDAFTAQGWDAWSCDLLPTEKPGQHHQGDIRELLDDQWDLMIAHPPCTHIAVSGAKHFHKKRADGRQMECALFFMLMVAARIPSIAVENPVGIMSRYYRKPDQIIQPWQFGHECTKATCLWLKRLPPLIPTRIVDCGIRYVDPKGKPHGSEFIMRAKVGYSPLMLLPKTQARWKIRSRTFPGIAEAMADQWTRALRPNLRNRRYRVYGKHFESMYEGSMYGSGIAVFAVWGYVISHARDGRLELNPRKLSDTLGGEQSEIEAAIKFLCDPDPRSRFKDHEGRRLIKEGEFQYFLPSWEFYHNIRNEEERRIYNRRKQAEYRLKRKVGKPLPGEAAYVKAERNGASEEELDRLSDPGSVDRSA